MKPKLTTVLMSEGMQKGITRRIKKFEKLVKEGNLKDFNLLFYLTLQSGFRGYEAFRVCVQRSLYPETPVNFLLQLSRPVTVRLPEDDGFFPGTSLTLQ